jgi:hypothetical protein
MISPVLDAAPQIFCAQAECGQIAQSMYDQWGACVKCHVTVQWGDDGFWGCANGLWVRNGVTRQGCGFAKFAGDGVVSCNTGRLLLTEYTRSGLAGADGMSLLGAGFGFAKGGGGLLEPFGHLFALGLVSDVVGVSSTTI